MKKALLLSSLLLLPLPARAAVPDMSFTVAMSEPVTVTGCPGNCPRIALDVGGVTRYATFSAGSGTSSLTFTYSPVAGDLDLDGISISSTSIDLNTSGTITDLNGNALAPLTFSAPNTSGLKVNYPSLSMNFIYDADGRYTFNGVSYDTLSTLLSAAGGTFTRNSTATYIDASGMLQTALAHTPRFDHNPSTLTFRGLLVEEARTNLFLRSSEFDSASWSKNGVAVTANATTAPDGSLSAEKLVAQNGVSTNANSPTGAVLQMPAVAASSKWSFTIYAKAAEVNAIRLREGAALGTRVLISLADGSVVYELGTSAEMSVTATQGINGWWRISAVRTTGAAETSFGVNIKPGIDTGNGTSGIYIWGGQLEQGGHPTSYIPTAGSTAFRPADTLIIPVGAWYNQTAGSFYEAVSWHSSSGPNYPMFWRVDDTTSANRWDLFYAQPSGLVAIDGFSGAVVQGGYSNAGGTMGTVKAASAQALNNTNAAFNGIIQSLDTVWTPPTVTRLLIGGGGPSTHWISETNYYPLRVADSQLQLLTQ